jgi:anoctamin-8
VIVNCALIGLSGPVNRIFPNMTATQTILLIIVLEVPTTLYITKLGFQ